MASLPMYVVVKSKYNNKYWAYEEKEGDTQGFIKCTGKDALSPLSKFQVERAESDSKAVHLLCCYNNKYLTAASPQGMDIAALADKPEEDQSKSSCTLFHPVPFGDDYRFQHLYSGKYLAQLPFGPSNPETDALYPLRADPDPDSLEEVFTVIDWSSLLVLPRYVAFKGDNDRYLASYWDNHNYLRFVGNDSGDATVEHEVVPTPDGSIRLKSKTFGMFWRRSPNWIWADSGDTSANNKDTLFWPVKLDDKTIALRNLGNNHFCARLTEDGNDSCLNASTTSIVKEARLEVVELVVSRKIYNVQFHPARARIYNEHVEVMGTGLAANTTDKENTMSVKMSHTETKSSAWSASVSLELGVTTTFETKVPFIAEGKIEISAKFSSEYQWGGSHTESNTSDYLYETVVPPMTKATVSALGSIATCDVPFSYTQTDTLMDGTKRTYNKDDGMYTGVNSYKVTYEVKNEKI